MQEKNYLKTPRPPGTFNSQVAFSLGATFLLLVILPVTFFMLKSRQSVTSDASFTSTTTANSAQKTTNTSQTKGVSGIVYVDKDNNGVYSAGVDQPKVNVGVVAQGSQTQTKAVTNAEGIYAFTQLPLGTYSFTVESPETHKILTTNGLSVILSPNSLSLTLLDIPLSKTQ